MATTIVRSSFITDTTVLGYSTGTTYYTTVTIGTPVYIGTDGASKTQKVVPITDSSAQSVAGIACIDHLDAAENNGIMPVALLPCVIRTDNVNATYPPAIGALVYLLDAGTWSDRDTNSSKYNYGVCIDINATDGTYLLNLTGQDRNTA
jgi:hypothetical protein